MLVPLITDLRGDTESGRQIAGPIVEQLVEQRLCRMAVVPELGGLGLSTLETLDVYEVLAAAEASVGWVAWNNSLPCLFSRFLSAESRAETFADPTWLYASSTRPSGKAAVTDDGYRVSGRWSLVSGCELAEWIPLMCLVEEGGELRMVGPGSPEVRFMFVRKGHYEILDTWNVGGLRGTGSHDVVVDDLFVAREHSLSPADPCTLEHPIARVPIIATLSAGFASQTLGVARMTIDSVVDSARTKVTPGPMPDLRDRAAAQAAVTRQSTEVAAARAYLHDCTGQIWAKALAGDAIGGSDLVTAFGAASYAIEVAHKTVETMYATAGTSALYVESPLERAHRDMHAMLRHVIAQPVWQEQAGRVMFGMDPTDPLFMV